MERRAIRVIVGGVEVDIPLGVFSGALPVATYNPTTGVLEGAAGGGGGGNVTGTGPTAVGRVAAWNDTLGTQIINTTKTASALVTNNSSSVAASFGLALFNNTDGRDILSDAAILSPAGGQIQCNRFIGPATGLRETGGATDLTMAAVPAGALMCRSGTTIAGVNPSVAGDAAQWDGANWIVKYQSVVALASNQTPASATLVDITGMTFSLPRAGTYWVDCSLVTSQSTSVAIAFGLNLSANFTRCGVGVYNPTTTTATAQGAQVANNTATASGTRSVTTNLPVTLTGSVTVSGAATLTVRAQRASGTLTIVAGSAARVVEL